MSLMISVSGIRGVVGESLTPKNLTAFAMAFASWTLRRNLEKKARIVIGRDTRPTGKAISDLVSNTLLLCGCDVIDLGIATTPTVEIAVAAEQADAGLIITASHNPVPWNALKMLNHLGEFLNAEEVSKLLDIAEKEQFFPARWDAIGAISHKNGYDEYHIDKVLQLPCIDPALIAREKFKVLVDCVEGAGFSIVPRLCERLGIESVVQVACGGTGLFPRNPEPIEENLSETITALQKSGCDFALVVDPDVDRLALLCEDGTLFGEEYTLVACADFYLKHKLGAVANNLSSSRALRDVAHRYGVACYSAKVGEANVSEVMKEKHVVIGGEGNGGVILPELHYGRDALVGIALIVQAFTFWRSENNRGTLSQFRRQFPDYFMSKQKIVLNHADREALDSIFTDIERLYHTAEANRLDGLKLDFSNSWVHLRPSNTEPIVRIYAEAPSKEEAEALASELKHEIEKRGSGIKKHD
ncbi:MAG: phosphoglucosamine mutase [Chlorobium sp.]|jgi:phosphomannomutase|nr:phosphoglucosamine mutase [Chlorobium sp.]